MLIKKDLNPVHAAVRKAYYYARTNELQLLNKAVGDYLRLGKEMPCATAMYKIEAIKEAREHFRLMEKNGIFNSRFKLEDTWKKMMKLVSRAEAADENFDFLDKFERAGSTLYPKTAKTRMKILNRKIVEDVNKIDAQYE